jgi:hypothetical protein
VTTAEAGATFENKETNYSFWWTFEPVNSPVTSKLSVKPLESASLKMQRDSGSTVYTVLKVEMKTDTFS